MKNRFVSLFAMLCIVLSLTSCATIFGGKVTKAQKTKPLPGQPSRDIRVVALVADILIFWPSAIVDFANGAIYRPVKTDKTPAVVTDQKPVSTSVSQ